MRVKRISHCNDITVPQMRRSGSGQSVNLIFGEFKHVAVYLCNC